MHDEMTNSDFICVLAEKAHPTKNPSVEHADIMDEAARRIRKLERERDEAREALALATSELAEQTFKLRQQLGKAREALQKIASMAHGSADKTVCLIMLNGISRVVQAALKKEAAK